MERKIEATGSIEVFANNSGTITIRQESMMGEEDLVIIQPTQVELVIKWLREVAEEIQNTDIEEDEEA